MPSLPHVRLALLALGLAWTGSSAATGNEPPPDEGLRFHCPPEALTQIEAGMADYLAALGIAPDRVSQRLDGARGSLVYTLNTPQGDTDTLNLKTRPELAIENETVHLPAPGDKTRAVETVSKKEILLALLQHGRLTEFKNGHCRIEALQDHVGLRQNIVAWAEKMDLYWPDGESAEWNDKYWNRGTPKPGTPLHAALNDVFDDPHAYAIGCYVAAKIVMAQGVLDYYRRIKPDPALYRQLEARLWANREPLVGIEPEEMWDFESDYDPGDSVESGKLLKIKRHLPPKNFVPGDWAYLLNADPATYRKTGYEGSNAIYLGRNLFDDFYNDHGHAYTFEQKANEVYQWRNGVFNRIRDAAKSKPLSDRELEALRQAPAKGGLLMDFRVFPYLF